MATKCDLSTVPVGGKQIRFLYFRHPNHFYVTSRRKEEDIPLFVGADVLAGASVLAKNHARIHSRYARETFATKIRFEGVRVGGINNSAHVWFYTVQGLFKASFEYLSTDAQRDCLLHMRDLWLTTQPGWKVPEQIDATYLNSDTLSLPPLSTSAADTSALHRLSQILNSPVAAPLQPPAEPLQPDSRGNDKSSVSCNRLIIKTDAANCEESNPKKCDLSSLGLRQMPSLSAPEFDGETDLQWLITYVCDFIYDTQRRKKSDTQCPALRNLEILLRFFKAECVGDTSGVTGFPCDILDQYTRLVTDKSMYKHFENSFMVPVRTNIALCLMSEWLGKELSGFSESIACKVEQFKLEHIDSINDLPSPQSLIELLFPACMKILMVNWMGQHETGYGAEERPSSGSVQTDHDYSPPLKRTAQCTKSRNSDSSVFPFVQLMLEFANNVLISGVAHVIYSRLLHDGSC